MEFSGSLSDFYRDISFSSSGVGSVEHSHSRGSLRDSTVDIRGDINGTSKGEFLSSSCGSWFLNPLDSGFSNSSSLGSNSTILGLGDSIDSSNSGSTLSRSDGSGIINLLGEWIGLDEEIKGPCSLGSVGGVQKSSLGSSSLGCSSSVRSFCWRCNCS